MPSNTVHFWLSQLRPNHPITEHYPANNFFLQSAAGLVLLLILIIIGYCLRQYIRPQKQKKIIPQITQIKADYASNKELEKLLENYNMMMKNIAHYHYPDAVVASMSGMQWLNFLDATGKTHNFSRGPGAVLGMYYHAENLKQVQPELLHSVITQWISRVNHV